MKNIRKAFAIIVPLTVAIFSIVQFASCEKYVLSELSLDPDTLTFDASGGSATFTVISNVSWERVGIQEGDSWISVSPEEGTGNVTITVTAEENSSSSERTATVYISSEIIKKSILITQQGLGE